jgi:hypothetical protein
MTMNNLPSKAIAALKRAPLLWLNAALVVCLCAGLAQPLVSDWMVKRDMGQKHRVVAVSGFFDFGSFLSSLSGMIQSFVLGLNTFIEAPVAELEKKSAALKEQAQTGLNVNAAKQADDAAIGAVDQVVADTPEACTIKKETMETVDAAHETGLLARARTQLTARRSMYTPSSQGAVKELLDASFNEYCSPESLARGSCKGAVSPKNMPDGDINANSIMGTSEGLSNKLSQDEIDAAGKYINWVTNPVPVENPPLAVLNSPAGQRMSVEMRRRAAISSVAEFSLNRIIAARSEKK